MSQYINRETYLEKLINRRDNGEVKVITGSRRCGKSWLLSRIYTDWLIVQGVPKENIILMTFDTDDLVDTEDLTDPKNLKAYLRERITSEDESYYVFLDEVQEVEGFKKIVIVGDDIATYTDEDGYVFMGLFQFLRNERMME